MNIDYENVFADVCSWAQAHGIDTQVQSLEKHKAGEFNGVAAVMNDQYAADERTFYLVHALGSIVRWSLSHSTVQAMFDELRAAKKDRTDRQRLERSIVRYRAFETESSEFAVWLLDQLGWQKAIPAYTNFMQADLEALTQFHRTGQAPVWRDFFARWNDDVKNGRRQLENYQPKPIPAFTPQRIENQEILQEQ